MQRALEDVVRERARHRCEYCQLEESASPWPHEIDHVIARKHGGGDEPDNLALACYPCNSYKGPNIAGIDPDSRRIVRLFHPRKDRWRAHFSWDGPRLIGLTRIGRATIRVLGINDPEFVAVRESMPPKTK